MKPTLFIGNKNYSSWSLRPWLALTWGGIDFDEKVIPLGGDGYGSAKKPEILAVSPSGRVPALHVGGTVIWDSLAICEWAAEQNPALWPSDAAARAVCRSAAAEMHSGFGALRRDLSMNIRRRAEPRVFAADTSHDITLVVSRWDELLARFAASGPYLFGARSIADAMYAPVCTRFRTYGVKLEGRPRAYADLMLADPAFRAWEQAAIAETWSIPSTDAL